MPPVIGKKDYKIDADQVQVVDKNGNYVSTDVESVLTEIYSKLGTGGGTGNIKIYTTIASEYPSTINTFFQDEGIEVYRSSPSDSDIVYDGPANNISFNASNTSNLKQFNCSVKNNYFYGALKSKIRLNNAGNKVRLRLNKSNLSYYELLVSGTQIVLYYVLNNSYQTIWSNSDYSNIPVSSLKEILFFKTGNNVYIYINGIRLFISSLNNISVAGKIEVVYEIPENTSSNIDCSYMEFGEIPISLLL